MITREAIMSKVYTQDEKQRLNEIARMLKDGTTKEAIMKKFDLSESMARAYISAVSLVVPTISHAGSKGYRRALLATDVPENERKIWDRLSRIKEMLYTILPNFDFEHKHNIKFSGLEKAIDVFLRELESPKIAEYFINLEGK